ncbi:MAG: MBL fold metallo-hydrolase [Paludibacter sp.]|jgi:glyoxylase-like metal-dependent hydrolase (beta-lactamase superfamily II)|nr:MBL fold metallo-hydrolase [Paludibacter sp.]
MNNLRIKSFTFNPIQENTYIISDETGEAAIIDAGCYYEEEKQTVRNYLESEGLTLKLVLNTHLHFDHQFGNRFLFDTYGLQPHAHRDDEFLLDRVVAGASVYGFPIKENAQPIGHYLNEGDSITFGTTTLHCIHVPGHCPGHVVFHDAANKVLFAGDVLFRGSIGRTDLERGNHAQLIKGITEKLLILPGETVVYSGHGPSTTIGEERSSNPYL